MSLFNTIQIRYFEPDGGGGGADPVIDTATVINPGVSLPQFEMSSPQEYFASPAPSVGPVVSQPTPVVQAPVSALSTFNPFSFTVSNGSLQANAPAIPMLQTTSRPYFANTIYTSWASPGVNAWERIPSLNALPIIAPLSPAEKLALWKSEMRDRIVPKETSRTFEEATELTFEQWSNHPAVKAAAEAHWNPVAKPMEVVGVSSDKPAAEESGLGDLAYTPQGALNHPQYRSLVAELADLKKIGGGTPGALAQRTALERKEAWWRDDGPGGMAESVKRSPVFGAPGVRRDDGTIDAVKLEETVRNRVAPPEFMKLLTPGVRAQVDEYVNGVVEESSIAWRNLSEDSLKASNAFILGARGPLIDSIAQSAARTLNIADPESGSVSAQVWNMNQEDLAAALENSQRAETMFAELVDAGVATPTVERMYAGAQERTKTLQTIVENKLSPEQAVVVATMNNPKAVIRQKAIAAGYPPEKAGAVAARLLPGVAEEYEELLSLRGEGVTKSTLTRIDSAAARFEVAVAEGLVRDRSVETRKTLFGGYNDLDEKVSTNWEGILMAGALAASLYTPVAQMNFQNKQLKEARRDKERDREWQREMYELRRGGGGGGGGQGSAPAAPRVSLGV